MMQLDAIASDPRPLLSEVRHIVAAADREGRDLTPIECDRCEALLDAAAALTRLATPDFEDDAGALRTQ